MKHRRFHRSKKNTPTSRPGARAPRPTVSPAAAASRPAAVAAPVVEGVLQRKPRFGFVLSETPGRPDLFVAGPSLNLAMNGDRVRARVTRAGGRPEGEILLVLERAHSTVVGTYQPARGAGRPLLRPEDNGAPVEVTDLNGLAPAADDLCVVKITRWPAAGAAPAGTLLEILGRRDDPAADLKFLLRKHGIADVFPSEVEREAASFGDDVPPDAWAGRRSFFDVPVFTIDGADAKDFDDAVSLEKRPQGWRLGVHIADVAHYVREGGPLDEEARRRSTSVYLSGAVVPMLPFPLSDNLCSLRPHVPRLTLTCLMDLDEQGRVVHHELHESVIRSARRFTYEEVEALLQGHAAIDASGPVRGAVLEMGRLARTLRERRAARGSLDFDFPEPYIVVDDRGWPVDARRRERGESHRLIEEFMLLANETVAQSMSSAPFLYRVHEKPDPAKMEALEKTLRAVGVVVPTGLHDGKPDALQKVLAMVKGKPVEPVVNMMILRSLKQAVYAPKNAGHFGLASRAYTHFTSPIRRYPDLLVHRLVKERLGGDLNPGRQEVWKARLGAWTADASARERVAVEAEREFLDLKRAQLMSRRVGETFDAVVTGVTSFGLFVQPTEVFVEGLVPVAGLTDDYYIFDEVRSQLRGRRTGRVYRLGQTVRVRLAAANTEKRQLDFALETPPRGPLKKR
jgi:ribonuclease R